MNGKIALRAPENIADYISADEIADIEKTTLRVGYGCRIYYVGHGTWQAVILDRDDVPLLTKKIREKNGAPGGWSIKTYPVQDWEVA
jgi:hypothetical protein